MRAENLTIRGKTYYWRARLLRQTVDCFDSTLETRGRDLGQMCLSLQTRDYDVAQLLARKLTMIRDELTQAGIGPFSSDQIKSLFTKHRDLALRQIAKN